MSHTPGPWRFDGQYVTDASGVAIAEVQSVTNKGNANAHLIAAAPEMLAALQGVVDAYPAIAGIRSWTQIRAAIAKAEGREA